MNISDVSVIVITHNRFNKLLNCLDCLERQTLHGFEVVVVVDGSTDQTSEALQKYTAKNFVLKVVNKPNEGRSLSRNRGAVEAQGNMLIFFDDDMRPFPECVAEHLSFMKSNDKCISVGTQEDDPSQAESDFDKFRIHIGKGWERALEQPKEDQKPYLTSANFCITKSAFEQLNGFDKNTENAEDFDLGVRATEKGIRVRYNQNARSWHDSNMGCVRFIKREIEYYTSFLEVAKRFPAIIKGDVSPYRPTGMKRLVYNILSRQFLIPLVDSNFFTFVMPRSVRYKFYDVLITGLSKVYPERFTLQQVRQHGR